VLRTVGPQGSLFELLLPAGMRVLSGELAVVDRVLDDRRLFVPFRAFFDPNEGRPSVPIETYLRLMFLKYRYGLGYGRLCAEVADSISWRRFCRIGLETSVPDESTVRKITRRCGPELIEALNRELLVAAHERGAVDVERVRADTTVVEADIKYPTDSGLLTAATCRIASRLRRLRAAGVKVSFVDRTSAARAHQHSIGAWLRRRSDEAKAEVLVITGQLADLATAAVAEATKALAYQARRRRVRRLLEELAVLVERTRRVIDQARARVNGDQPPGATRLVSLHEPDARPIRKGRLGKPVEFGYKAQVVDNPDGLILDHSVHIGNPSDTELLRPAIERIRPPNSASHRRWSPPTVATGTRPSRPTSPPLAWAPWSSRAPASRPPRGRASSTPTTSSTLSSGAPDAKDASPTSNATGPGGAPDCAVTPAPASGAPTVSSLTT
jgi:IS5 family transposase